MTMQFNLIAPEKMSYASTVVDGLRGLLERGSLRNRQLSNVSFDLLNCNTLSSSINPSSDMIGVMYHVPINQDKDQGSVLIKSFDVPRIKQEKLIILQLLESLLRCFFLMVLTGRLFSSLQRSFGRISICKSISKIGFCHFSLQLTHNSQCFQELSAIHL